MHAGFLRTRKTALIATVIAVHARIFTFSRRPCRGRAAVVAVARAAARSRCCAAIGVALLCTGWPIPAAAEAQTAPVAAGDTLVQAGTKCTLGYVYRVSEHTMGVTSGHCAQGGSPVRDLDAGIAGRSISATFTGADRDWWLIDFGDVAWSQRITNTPYLVVTYTNPVVADEVCHYGAGSRSVACGLVTDVNGAAVSVTNDGRAGDSGGPCFIRLDGDDVAAVGLWHGHRQTNDSGGYFVSLAAALNALRNK